jgi:hypothetical protein
VLLVAMLTLFVLLEWSAWSHVVASEPLNGCAVTVYENRTWHAAGGTVPLPDGAVMPALALVRSSSGTIWISSQVAAAISAPPAIIMPGPASAHAATITNMPVFMQAHAQ